MKYTFLLLISFCCLTTHVQASSQMVDTPNIIINISSEKLRKIYDHVLLARFQASGDTKTLNQLNARQNASDTLSISYDGKDLVATKATFNDFRFRQEAGTLQPCGKDMCLVVYISKNDFEKLIDKPLPPESCDVMHIHSFIL